MLPQELPTGSMYTPRGVAAAEVYYFSSGSNLGFNLLDAFSSSYGGLDGKDDAVFPADWNKARYYFSVLGYDPFVCLKNMQRTVRGRRQPALRSKVAQQVAQVVAMFINKAATMRIDDGTYRFGHGGIELRHLYLVELRRYGKTFQPILMYDAALLAEEEMRFNLMQSQFFDPISSTTAIAAATLNATSYNHDDADTR